MNMNEMKFNEINMNEVIFNNEYFYDLINNSQFIKENTKLIYIKTIKYILQNIFINKTIYYILNNPQLFYDELNKYIVNKNNHSFYFKFIVFFLLFNNDKNFKNNHKDIYFQWKKIIKIIKNPIDIQYLSNKPWKKQAQGFISYDKLLVILNNIPRNKIEKLLLAMYILISPVRSDYYECKIYNNSNFNANLIWNEDSNFIVFDYFDYSKSYIILKKYKTNNIYGDIKIDIPQQLNDIIRDSLMIQPREYLFVDSKNKPFTKNNFNKWANSLLKKILNKYFNLTMFRHVYLSRPDLNLNQESLLNLSNLSNLMGHSVNMQKKYMWSDWINTNNYCSNIIYDIINKI